MAVTWIFVLTSILFTVRCVSSEESNKAQSPEPKSATVSGPASDAPTPFVREEENYARLPIPQDTGWLALKKFLLDYGPSYEKHGPWQPEYQLYERFFETNDVIQDDDAQAI